MPFDFAQGKLDDVGIVIGALVINHPMEVAPLTAAVKGKVDISLNKDKLGDSSFDLKDLLG